MAAGAIIRADMGETGIFGSPPIGAVAACTLVIVVIFRGRRMASQTIFTGTIVAETNLTPVIGVMTGRTLSNFVSRRCCMAGPAIRETGMAEISLLPTASAVAIGAFPGIVICRALVAHFTIHVLAVVDGFLPAFSVVAHAAG
jgi:hypothetical protein